MTATAKPSLPPTASLRNPQPSQKASFKPQPTHSIQPHAAADAPVAAVPPPPLPCAAEAAGHSQPPLRTSHFSSECTTDLTFRRFRSTYVCPTPQNIMGAPDVYTIDSAAPTCT